jgi:hypothetical protein
MIIILLFIVIKIVVETKIDNLILNAKHNHGDIHYYEKTKHKLETILTYSELIMYPFFLSTILFLKWYNKKINIPNHAHNQ